MHPELGLAGWAPWAILIVSGAIFLGSVAVLVDSLRRTRERFGRLGRWPYVVVQGTFIVLTIGGVVPNSPIDFPAILGLVLLIAVAQIFVYLLRVAFPIQSEQPTEISSGE